MKWFFDPKRDTGAIVTPEGRTIWYSDCDALRIEQRMDEADSPEDEQDILTEEASQ